MDIYPDERRIRSAPEYQSSWFGMKGVLAGAAVAVLGLFFYFMDDLNVFLSGDQAAKKTIALEVPALEETHLTPVETPVQIEAQKPAEFTEPVIHQVEQQNAPAPQKEVTAEIGGDEDVAPPVKQEEIIAEPEIKVVIPEEKIAEPEIKAVTSKEKVAEAEIKHNAPKILKEKPPIKKHEELQKTNATYALQLLGGSDKAKIQKFIHERKLGKEAVISHTKRGSEDWYIVLYGNYSNREEALLNIKKLPSTVHDVQPWPRKFADAGTIIK